MLDSPAKVRDNLSQLLNMPIVKLRPVGGSTFDQTCVAQSNSESYFVKFGTAGARLRAEYEGLLELEKSNSVRVPHPIAVDEMEKTTYLVTEYISFARPRSDSYERLGCQLAKLHQFVNDKHGWHSDNFIGATPQPNTQCANWLEFFGNKRLSNQLKLARENGYGGEVQTLGMRMLDKLPNLIDHTPIPSLLHGDLWSGNCSFDTNGNPVIFDPAVYYGDCEADIAMTSLFGGFPSEFYRAYQQSWPLTDGHHERSDLYQLYHILNHLNLFGGTYLVQAESIMRRLLSLVE